MKSWFEKKPTPKEAARKAKRETQREVRVSFVMSIYVVVALRPVDERPTICVVVSKEVKTDWISSSGAKLVENHDGVHRGCKGKSFADRVREQRRRALRRKMEKREKSCQPPSSYV
mmetsp:Transcript_17610/g.49821  ORF Transcript_17610/g.49821 Transcript_17610/m.49821 type:complete len:116 (+) Transcript_17610:333-680(+)